MSISEKHVGDAAEIIISGTFTFADSNDFRGKLSGLLGKGVKELKINISDLETIDSAGLGMFLVAHGDCKQKSVDFSLYKPKGSVKSLLEATKSYDRFKIVD